MSLTEEARAVEAHWPGWHVFMSDAGKPWAVRVHHPDETGCGVTAGAEGWALIEHEIAKAERELARWRDEAERLAAVRALQGTAPAGPGREGGVAWGRGAA